jgi:hypothetical protein
MNRFKAMTDVGCEECPLNETECAKQADMIPIGCIVPHPDGDLVKLKDVGAALAMTVEELIEKLDESACTSPGV